jgi:hypothetical protein
MCLNLSFSPIEGSVFLIFKKKSNSLYPSPVHLPTCIDARVVAEMHSIEGRVPRW